ncbi:MAG: polysaccharide biosynthesis/export family protein [Gemmatimonadetes bacterium]|nr:polysaccharide biosynthesis/export family protein [Gemmatimonadota bacterium]
MKIEQSRRAAALVLCLLAVIVGPSGARSQVWDSSISGGAMLSREDLNNLLQQYELSLQSPAYSGRIKEELKAAIERVQDRLQHGDFEPGDRVVLSVQGQPDLPDTVPVELGPKITLPLFGDISLDGVLRSEITDHLTKELGKMIRDPVVHAQGLMRLSVQGAVVRPGFYVVPTDILVSEALMLAGGPAQNANLTGLRIERGTREIYQGQELQTAMRQGRTLDQLSLQAGDQIVLPVQNPGIWGTVLRYGLIITSTLLLGVRIVG